MVIGEDMVKSAEAINPRPDIKYEVADGTHICNLGEKAFGACTDDGTLLKLRAQVTEVNKALLSVHKVISAGNKVVFDEDGSYIEDKVTQEKMWIREDRGMYMLRMWVRKPFSF